MDDLLEENSFASSEITRKNSIAAYSPTTGTCQMNLFSSPIRSKERKHRKRPSNGKTMTHFNLTEEDDEFMTLLSEVEKSSEEIVKIIQNLHSIQAFKGNRELENLIGTFYTPRFLKREMKKTKELMTKVTKQKLFEKKSSVLPHKELYHLDSYEFLKSILNQDT
ncbi:centromere protein R isoform 2-T2 [Thomomys bottae]